MADSGDRNMPDELKAELCRKMRDVFGDDQKRIDHTMTVLAYAEEILAGEDGPASMKVVIAAAILHDIGIHQAERKHGSPAGEYQEIEGPPIARELLGDCGFDEAATDHVSRIVANHHSAKDIDTPEFRIVWDADWLVNLAGGIDRSDTPSIEKKIRRIFKTVAGRQIAERIYLETGKENNMSMFCYQCEQTAKGTGCTSVGVCGKDPKTAALQDLLVYAAKDISRFAHAARALGVKDRDVDVFVIEALFTTITNVNFDPSAVLKVLRKAAGLREKVVALYADAAGKAGQSPEKPAPAVAWWEGLDGLDEAVRAGQAVTLRKRIDELGDDVAGLQELMTYGLKGSAAYVDHAHMLGVEDDEVYAGFHAAMDYLAGDPRDVGELTGWCLKVGELNLRAMELLDTANTGRYGHPEPTQIRVTPIAGKCIVVSGHDLEDLGQLLEQTAGTGINVYTHGEMLPCLAYPGLKKYEHLVGNYGGAWQEQRREFDAFPGAILMTTNCIQRPKSSYNDRIFTTGLVAFPGVTHISPGPDGKKDFSAVIAAALAADGFAEDAPEQFITTGFAHNAVMSVAGQVIDAVKAGKIRHFFLIGGCDGAKPGRNYYTELAQQVPDDCVILTLACGKFRFNKLPFGDIDGIPRLLDVGQCNDAYSAIQIALALADAFDCGVNDLPLSMILSWFEQKAVGILLTLLHLGVKGIKIGPTLPAFVSSNVLNVLVENFDLAPITTPQEDIAAALGE